jgi:hypothetical protein
MQGITQVTIPRVMRHHVKLDFSVKFYLFLVCGTLNQIIILCDLYGNNWLFWLQICVPWSISIAGLRVHGVKGRVLPRPAQKILLHALVGQGRLQRNPEGCRSPLIYNYRRTQYPTNTRNQQSIRPKSYIALKHFAYFHPINLPSSSFNLSGPCKHPCKFST